MLVSLVKALRGSYFSSSLPTAQGSPRSQAADQLGPYLLTLSIPGRAQALLPLDLCELHWPLLGASFVQTDTVHTTPPTPNLPPSVILTLWILMLWIV